MSSPYAAVTADPKQGRVITHLELPGEAPGEAAEVSAEADPLQQEQRRSGKPSLDMDAASEQPARATDFRRRLSKTTTSLADSSLDGEQTKTFRLMSNQNMTAWKLFQQLDRDRSGCLDYEEVGRLASLLHVSLKKAQVRQAFMEMDENRDGDITFVSTAPHTIHHTKRLNHF